jgi:hypothetical protein
MAFNYDEFYANLALSSVKKQHYIRTMETYFPEMEGWSERFQTSLSHHPHVKNFIDQATEIACDKGKTKNLLTSIRGHFQEKRINNSYRSNTNQKADIKTKISMAEIVYALNNRDATKSLEHFGVPKNNAHKLDQTTSETSSSVNDQGLFSPEQQPSYQVIFNI